MVRKPSGRLADLPRILGRPAAARVLAVGRPYSTQWRGWSKALAQRIVPRTSPITPARKAWTIQASACCGGIG